MHVDKDFEKHQVVRLNESSLQGGSRVTSSGSAQHKE